MDLANKVAIITGGASGIGYEIAKSFAKAGAIVIISDIQAEKASENALHLFKQFDRPARSISADITQEHEVESLINQVIEEFDKIDVLVNNAGIQYVSSIDSFPIEKWKKLIDIMLTAPFILTQKVLPHMRKRKSGSIINMASVHSHVASPYKSAYIAAKHGLLGFTKATALETAEFGITVNAICPGFVDTPLIRNQLKDLGEKEGLSMEEVLEKVILSRVPQRKLITPQEIAEIAVFLASKSAQSITGQSIIIDGGVTIQ